MEIDTPGADYHLTVCDDPHATELADWNALLAAQPAPTPFMRLEYLQALHDSGSATPDTGWSPRWLVLRRRGELLAACALYLKAHSYGEYVFDWAWADAYRRHGLRYYPKLLGAVPFTPVPGTRLLAFDATHRALLAHAIRDWARQQRWSSAHLLFLDEADRQALADAGWMLREGVQFHWEQEATHRCTGFADMLSRLQRDKRKKIQQERRRVAEAGVSFTVHEGAAIDASLWDFFHQCYRNTYAEHHSTPYLSREFFAAMADRLPEHWVMFVARRASAPEQPIAASLIAVDHVRHTAWGRYWGCSEHVPCLHFEACYYQPLQWCLENGIDRFEGGAQGEHKMARGLMPVATWSAHWVRDEHFADAVGDFLAREGQGIEAYLDELRERSPFKTADAGLSPSPPGSSASS